MGSQDFGSQILSFDFNEDATGKKFNKTQYGLTPSGIYSGFTLERFSDSMVRITTGVCYIHDNTSEIGTRIETQQDVILEIDSTRPYVVLRFDWIDATDNFMDFVAVPYDSIEEDDLVVGRVIYENSGTVMTENYDYTRRNNFYNKRNRDTENYFKVLSTEPISKKVFVTSGVLNSPKGNLYISGGFFPSVDIPDTTTGSRYDIVYIDENGTILVEQGIQSSNPSAPRYGNRKVLAEIRRGPNRNSIYGSEIYPVLTSFDMSAYPSDLTIVDANNLYSSNNVESALQEIAGSPFTFKGKKTFNNSINVIAGEGDVGETIKGSTGQDIQRILKSDNTVVQSVSSTGKLINTVGTELALLDKYGTFTVDKVEEAINQISGEAFTFKETKTFDKSPIVPNATANQHPITKSVYDAHIAKTGQSSLGHVKSGGNITINSDGTITIANNTITTDSAHISDATNLNTANKVVKRDSNGNFSAGTITATLSGNSSTASNFNSARTIKLDGLNNTTVSSSSNNGNHTLDIKNIKVSNSGYADSAGSAGSASKITGTTINGVFFDGTTGITISDSTKEVAFSKNTAFNKNFETNSNNIKANGVASVGSSSNVARSDHVHPKQTDITGNAGTATALRTPRSIGGVEFDGTANIPIPSLSCGNAITAKSCSGNSITATKFNSQRKITIRGVVDGVSVSSESDTGAHSMDISNLKVANSTKADSAITCDGNSATATKLKTSRKIGGVEFDGTADIPISSLSCNYAITAGSCSGNATTATTAITAHHIPTSDPGGVGAIWLA